MKRRLSVIAICFSFYCSIIFCCFLAIKAFEEPTAQDLQLPAVRSENRDDWSSGDFALASRFHST